MSNSMVRNVCGKTDKDVRYRFVIDMTSLKAAA